MNVRIAARRCMIVYSLLFVLVAGCSEEATTGTGGGSDAAADTGPIDTSGGEPDMGGVKPPDTATTDAGDTTQATPCETDADCSELAASSPCIKAWCDEETSHCAVANVVNGTPCDDGDACTEETVCFQGLCGGVAVVDTDPGELGAPCFENPDCKSGFCITLTETTSICTELCIESCQKGFQCKSVVNLQQDVTFICVPIGGTGYARDCDDANPCTADLCDPASGCMAEPAAGSCDDGNACTEADACEAGVCTGTPSPTCACVADADCAPFDDGDLCNGVVRCIDGGCASDPDSVVKCPSGEAGSCVTLTCEPSTGQCMPTSSPDGAACSDGNGCTQPDRCTAGVCTGGQYICGGCADDADCAPFDDANACNGTLSCLTSICALTPGSVPTCTVEPGSQCQAASCDPATGACSSATAPNGTPCSDGDPCTLGDVCTGGACTAGAMTCDLCLTAPDGTLCDDSDPCTAGEACGEGMCKGGTDVCAACDGLAEGAACDDGQDCTSGDACTDGICSGVSYACDDGDDCTDDVCDGQGGCSYPTAADGTACVDDDPCTADDQCAAGVCQPGTGLACDDGSPCTIDACDPDTGCSHEADEYGIPCEDGNFCTTEDLCVAGFCLGAGDADCDDGNPCTADSCDLVTGCVHAAVSGGACEDGNACTTGDACVQGLCFPGKALGCDDGNLCTDDACDEATGCTNVANAAPCTDGNPCSASDTCAGGTCESGPNICQCTTDVDCEGQATDLCTGKLVCVSTGDFSFCMPDPATQVVCPESSSPCVVNACDPATGACAKTPANEGAACEDGNACSGQSACVAGACVGGESLTCDDGNACTEDSCDPVLGCVYVPADVACDDGNPCSAGDTCKDKSCIGMAMVICDDGNPCTDDVCDPESGCAFAMNEAPCSDGNPCTSEDFCADGVCGSGINICGCEVDADCADYEDGDACNGTLFCDTSGLLPACAVNPATVVTCDGSGDTACAANACDPATGTCAVVPQPDGAQCDDDDACTIGDACLSGACASEGGAGCDDGNPCTTDACDAALGCTHADAQGACDDGNSCTVGDTCVAGACTSGENTCGCQTDADCADLDDGDLCNGLLHCDTAADVPTCVLDVSTVVTCPGGSDVCHVVACEPSTGACISKTGAEGQPCDDGNFCTQQDVCVAGLCVGTLPVSCNDNNTCTVDACSPAVGCVHTPIAAPCEDGDLCTKGDKCTAGHCVSGKNVCKCKADGDCDKKDDANACNGTYQCVGAQKSPSKPKTEGFCIPAAGTVVSCLDTEFYDCVAIQCDPATGACGGAPVAEGTPCDDGDGCTTGDHCEQGTCIGSGSLVCDDGNPCTAATCDPIEGCVVAPTDGVCDDTLACTTGDSCQEGSCIPADNDCGCVTDADCVQWEDGDPCNGTLACTNGRCHVEPATIVVCSGPPTGPCMAPACDPATGGCTEAPVADGTSCNDLEPCTMGDTCAAGACTAGDPVECDDHNQCTTDVCLPGKGCSYTPRNGSCDDGNACSFPDICANGQCLPKNNKCD